METLLTRQKVELQRLAGLSEPRLYKLREELARERSALLALPQPDLTSAALTFLIKPPRPNPERA